MANYPGTAGNDNIKGTSGVDTIHDGGGGDDLLKGEGGNDVITVTGGADTVKGGDESYEGYDTLVVDYSAKTAAVRTLANNAGYAAGAGDIVKMVGIERVSVMGGSGDDSLRGADSRDTLLGGGGDDTLDGGAGGDTLEGGDGIDTVSYAEFETPGTGVRVELANLRGQFGLTVDRLVGIERVIGCDGSDSLTGSSGGDTLLGGKGADVLHDGPGGDDHLLGEAGFDYLQSTGGADTVDGRTGDDRIVLTGTGDRIVHGGTGDDELSANFSSSASPVTTVAGGYTNGAGASVMFDGIERLALYGGTGADSLLAGRGNDFISGGGGKDTIDGGKGDDSVTIADGVAKGGGGLDRLTVNFSTSSTSVTTLGNGSFTNGAQTVAHAGFEGLNISGGTVADTLVGGDGNDSLNGNAGEDSLSGGKGADRLTGGLGGDTLTGGQGVDTASYSSIAGDLTIDLNKTVVQDTGGGGLDLLLTIENLEGGGGADTLIGDKEANSLNGGSGADTLFGGAGDDILEGGFSFTNAGNRLDGGKGNDTVRAVDGAGADTLEGGAGIDTIWVSPLGFLGAPAGVVDLAITTAQDTGAGMDVITGFENARGGSGADTLSGAGDANRLEGGNGADQLNGRDGTDTLVGGLGADVLSGGADADRFVYLGVDDSRAGIGFGVDEITDFAAGDLIDLSAIDADISSAATDEAFTFVAAFSGDAGQATLDYDGGADLTTVRGDVDGDGAADFELIVAGEVVAGDFIA